MIIFDVIMLVLTLVEVAVSPPDLGTRGDSLTLSDEGRAHMADVFPIS